MTLISPTATSHKRAAQGSEPGVDQNTYKTRVPLIQAAGAGFQIQRASSAEPEAAPFIQASTSELEPVFDNGRIGNVSATWVHERFISSRFTNVVARNSQTTTTTDEHPVIYRCEDEPIHTPGAVQKFGALIALRESEDKRLLVHIASENSQAILGRTPEELFSLRSFTDLLSHRDKATFAARVQSFLALIHRPNQKTNPDVFSISLTSL
jgi:hypothetical protein